MERAGAPNKLKEAIVLLNQEDTSDLALEVLQSSSGKSLGSARETSSSRIRESAGIILGSLTSCSAEAVMELQTRQIISTLLLDSDDASMRWRRLSVATRLLAVSGFWRRSRRFSCLRGNIPPELRRNCSID